MKRTTKAMARLGTLAVIAGTILGTPLALGTANAVVADDAAAVNGSIVSNEVAAAHDFSTHPNNGAIEVKTNIDNPTITNDTINLTGSAYFPTTQTGLTSASTAGNAIPGFAGLSGPGANVTIISPKQAKCTGTSPCVAIVDDPVAEQTTATVVDPNGFTTNTSVQISFNGIFFTNCPGSGIDTFANTTYGSLGEATLQNCVTQGQFGGNVMTLVAHYAAASPSTANQNQRLFFNLAGGHAFFVQQSGSTTIVGPTPFTTASCTTDASGNCTIAIVNPGPAVQNATTTETSEIAVTTDPTISNSVIGLYPTITSSPTGGVAPTQLINWGTGSVAVSRLNLIASQVVAPQPQETPPGFFDAEEAEPGDAVQLTYELTGGCTPNAAAIPLPFITCAGTPLAGVNTTVSVDHGFFTPNCQQQAGIARYEGCSFTTTPALNVPVGNLTSSGTTESVTTGVSGTFTVTVGIARDAGFDNNGYLAAHVTDGALHSVNLDTFTGPPGDGRVQGQTCSNQDTPEVADVDNIGDAIDLDSNPRSDNCPVDLLWTTDEQPLNGGTAKYVVVPRTTNPTNVFINSENNYSATDSGTNNIPDVGRVVYVVHITDQFGNLTSNDGADGADQVDQTKTGPGRLWWCGGGDFSVTNACTANDDTIGGAVGGTGDEQSDGTFDQEHAARGSYLDSPDQHRYQADDSSNDRSGGVVGCYSQISLLGLPLGACAATGPAEEQVAGQTFIGLEDGLQTDMVTWTPPTTYFTSFLAGSPNTADYGQGNGAAVSDALKLNFYNQLAAPVVTFAVVPGNSVPTATAVTVTGTVADQFGNGIVGWNVQFVRSGANESSCTPIQNGENNAVEVTNQAGVAGYTFSCDAPGTSNVTIVVVGPGGTQLASGREAVTFTGSAVKVKNETPTIKLTSHLAHHLTVHITTHPGLNRKRINIYRKVNGLYHLIGSVKTGPKGHATKHLHGLNSGARYHVAVKAVGIGVGYHSHYSKHKTIHIA